MMRSAPVPAAERFHRLFDFLFPFPQPFQQRDAEAKPMMSKITDAESDTCLSLYLGAGCTEIRSQMDVRVRYLQQPLQLGHQRPHGAAGPAIGCATAADPPRKDHGQTQGVDSHPPPGRAAPASGPPQVRQRRADILEAQRELFPLLGRLLLLLCFSLGFFLLLGLLLCLRLFRRGSSWMRAGPAMTVSSSCSPKRRCTPTAAAEAG